MKTPIATVLLALTVSLSASLGLSARAAAAAAEAPKVLRYAFPIAETGFDPPRISDIYSRVLTSHIYEALYTYDPLARPVKIVPLIADGLPEVSDDFRTYTIHLKHGIYFVDDPAFKGKPREVTAQDFVYSFKRFADPRYSSANWSTYEEAGLVGLAELHESAIKQHTPFPYDTDVEGLRALDRYTLQLKTRSARPRLVGSLLVGSDLVGAVAREAVEFYGDKIGEHPIGTGPFMLKSWRRSSQIVLVRNPAYRERYYEAQPNADDAEGHAILQRFKGRRLPMIDQVEVSIIEEAQPRWLSFLNGEQDFMERVPDAFFAQAMPGNKLAPNLAKRGIQAMQVLAPDTMLTMFNMKDPMVGGYTPAQVALRRAIGLGFNVPLEMALVRHGSAVPAQSTLQPFVSGYDPAFKSEMGDYDPARAKALLDVYGFVDRDGDGWREKPDGSPLVIERKTQADGLSRQIDEIWDKSMKVLGIRMNLTVAQWPENLKAAEAGSFMTWDVALQATSPDGLGMLIMSYGKADGTNNYARFATPEFDRLYERMQAIPDGPERDELFRQAKLITIVYEPYKAIGHRLYTDLAQPWVIGYRRPLFAIDWWEFVDIDASKKPRATP